MNLATVENLRQVAYLAIAAACIARGLTLEEAERAVAYLMDGSGRPLPSSVAEAYRTLNEAFAAAVIP